MIEDRLAANFPKKSFFPLSLIKGNSITDQIKLDKLEKREKKFYHSFGIFNGKCN